MFKPGIGGKQVASGVSLSSASHGAAVQNLRLALQQRHPAGCEPRLDAQHQLAHHLVLARHHAGQVERHTLHVHPIARSMLCLPERLGRVKQRLGRDTSLIQANASHGAFFYQQHAQPGFPGCLGSCIPGRPPADDNHLVFHKCIVCLVCNLTIPPRATRRESMSSPG